MTTETKWKLEPTGRWIRAKFGGETIAESKHAQLLIESSHQLVYYFPKSDVRMELLTSSGQSEKSGYKGMAVFYTLQIGEKVAEDVAWVYPETQSNRPNLSDYIAFKWESMDAWYEENEEVFVHPRNPYHRVDTIPSTRHIRVVVDGETVAETTRAALLFETGLPTRYYIPQEDIRMDALEPTQTHSRCPYKGLASYWSITANGKTHADLAWGYLDPIPETPKIRSLISFYNEKLDIYVDGILEGKPRTVWS